MQDSQKKAPKKELFYKFWAEKTAGSLAQLDESARHP